MRAAGRVRALGAGLALTLLAVAGCGGGSDDGDGPVTLEFLSLAWQAESIDANKALVEEWNAANPDVQIRYVQGSWDNIHDYLLTSFEGGEAPDIIHNDASDLTDFANGGYLADLTGLLPQELRADIPEAAWSTTEYDGGEGLGIYGVPFLQEPRVLVVNAELLERSGARVPTPEEPWSWAEFEAASAAMTEDTDGDGDTDTYGVAWSMKEPVTQTVNLALSTGGEVFTREDGKNVVRYDAADSSVAELINRQVHEDGTAAASSLGMSGSDTLPGFYDGRYAMLPLNFSFRQQVSQQAPDGFDWTVLPMPSGGPEHGLAQGVAPQTLSVAEDSDHQQAAADFIAFLTQPEHQVDLALGDWMLPTSERALAEPALDTEEYGWRTGTRIADELRPSPVLGVRGYPEWKDKIATPALQEYYSGGIDLDTLRDKLTDDGQRILDRYQR
ncbi:extracellular solute-binding protein [Streptomyces sp. 3MP-14]|uniref:Extracellular solute-binding protein n=1 Tax=Streptomyces mimosae TaxID=2586635 RepID=A0A5N5ZZW4_9ACTN|nr:MULTISPECIES: sugar ABC transporter substrate-binding protein [Streptomyces]KAB8161309.1 extracellular solute-binding protein [Streptomyces mimosae]KAB8173111.1 extracellular solute-binding protein [Streptomyces sp. 3MP-14]